MEDRNFAFILPKIEIIWFSNLLTLIILGEVYSKEVLRTNLDIYMGFFLSGLYSNCS